MRASARIATAIVLCAGTGACALLRSTPRAPEEWTFVAFPDARESGRARVGALAATSAVASACAAPNAVTFVVELSCADADAHVGGAGRLLVASNFGTEGYGADVLRAIMLDASARERFASQTVSLAQTGGFGGLLLDFRLLGPRDARSLLSLVAAVADSARAANAGPVGIVIPVADTAAYPGRHLGALADFLALQVELSPAMPGAITPADRMSAFIGARAGEIGAHRLVLLIPADGYVWRDGEGRARVSFAEATAIARDWGAELVRDESSATLRARAPRRGEVWVNDAVLIRKIVRDARRLGIRRFALYGLGGEDPAIWAAVGLPQPATR